MSQEGHAQSILVGTFPMPSGTRFGLHVHAEHQLAWASEGVLIVLVDGRNWVLPPTRALFIPGGVPHEVVADGRTTMRSLYLQPSPLWPTPQPVAVGPLLAELIAYLGDTDLDPDRRERAEAVVMDLLHPVATTSIETRLPDDPRAEEVAVALLADPADGRTLTDWGRTVGASGRTLARAFATGTGVPFGRWRAAVRIQAALPLLAAGLPVTTVARRVGYGTPSAFVAAFRRETGQTPGAYFRQGGLADVGR